MDSIFKHRTRERIVAVIDTSYGAQATSKSITKYVRSLKKEAGLLNEGAGSLQDFMRDFSGGI